MRKIQLLPDVICEEVRGGSSVTVSMKHFLIDALDMYAPSGRGVKMIRQAIKIINAIEEAKDELKLEDTEFDVLKAAVDQCPSKPRIARALLPFYEAIESVGMILCPQKD